MSENSILKRWITRIPFAAYIFIAMMSFALLASMDANATPEEDQAFYDYTVNTVLNAEPIIERIVRDLGPEEQTIVRDMLMEIMESAYNLGFIHGFDDALAPDLGCITDTECEALDDEFLDDEEGIRYFTS